MKQRRFFKHFTSILTSFILLFCVFSYAQAWTNQTLIYIAVEARRIMPENVQKVLKRFQDDLFKGLLDKKNGNVQFTGEEEYAAAMTERAEAIITLSRERTNFSRIIHEMGGITRMAAELNHPIKFSSRHAACPYKNDFDKYIEKNLSRFHAPYRRRDVSFDSPGALRSHFKETWKRSEKHFMKLDRAFRREDEILPASSFDYRSVPFGIASIAYRNAIHNVADAWCYVLTGMGWEIPAEG